MEEAHWISTLDADRLDHVVDSRDILRGKDSIQTESARPVNFECVESMTTGNWRGRTHASAAEKQAGAGSLVPVLPQQSHYGYRAFTSSILSGY